MLKKIAAVCGALVLIFCAYVAFQPNEYFIKREIVINAPAEAIFPHLASMKKADEWMPWRENDPNVKMNYSGPEEGVGSLSSWESTGDMGVGKAEVMSMEVNQNVKTRITYTKPMVFVQDSEFILTPQGDATTMAWTVKGQSNFISRFMCTLMMMDMDKYIGGMFEKGLSKLKGIVESNPR